MIDSKKTEKIKDAIASMKVALEDYSDGKRKSFQNKVSSELLGYLELALPELASNLGIRQIFFHPIKG